MSGATGTDDDDPDDEHPDDGDPPVGIVLCGGRSTRMGRDKALIGDPAWAHRVASVLDAAGCRPTVLAGGDPSLGLSRWDQEPDTNPGAGPGAALADACRKRPGRSLVVAACDLPHLVEDDVRTLVDAVRHGAAVAVYDLGGAPQWSLVAVGGARGREIAQQVTGGSPPLHRLLAPGAVHLGATDPRTVTDIDEP